jgi:uncharacterized integral membrane protein
MEHPDQPTPEPERRAEGRRWAIVVVLALVVAYVIAFAVENTTEVPVHWVFATTRTSFIWALFLTLAFGIVIGLLLPQLYRRRRRRREHRPQG